MKCDLGPTPKINKIRAIYLCGSITLGKVCGSGIFVIGYCQVHKKLYNLIWCLASTRKQSIEIHISFWLALIRHIFYLTFSSGKSLAKMYVRDFFIIFDFPDVFSSFKWSFETFRDFLFKISHYFLFFIDFLKTLRFFQMVYPSLFLSWR